MNTKLIVEKISNFLFIILSGNFLESRNFSKFFSNYLRFIVRDFVYDEQSLKAGKNERDKLVQEKQRQYAPLVRWLKINFGEIFSAYVHVKALRIFVESVLR